MLARARRNRGDLPRWLLRRPQLGLAVGVYESALLACGRLSPELKVLATSKVAMKVNCEFCLDIGSAIARIEGVDEQKLLALPQYAESDLFSDLERLVVTLADEMTKTPALVPVELRAALLTHLSKAELMELAAEIAWENQRARLNQALGVRPSGFSDGSFCLVPEPAQRS